ncbi:MAG: GNAT family N-acetyltransferase [Gemmatimonadota bacterium]
MWRPDRSVGATGRAGPQDIEVLNRVFADAFTDRYRRDGMVGVRVPHLNPRIWRFAIEDAGDGALVWRDAAGDLVGFNMVHRSGTEGWMGPLAVRPDRQGHGLGKMMVQAGIEWLRARGAVTIGLETMPRTVENIGFYSRLGFLPNHLTVTLVKDLPLRRPAEVELASAVPRLHAVLDEARALAGGLVPGVDFSREVQLTLDLGLGDAVLVRQGGALTGFALWHSAPLALGRVEDELRVLKLAAKDSGAFQRVLAAVEDCAARVRVRRVAVRCQTAFVGAYRRLVHADYRVHWTDLRMTLDGYPERMPRGDGVVFSNWEI